MMLISTTPQEYQTNLYENVSGKNGGAWLPKKRDVNPFLQIDVGHVTTVQQIATQGNPASAVRHERHKRWVEKFSLEFSEDGENWSEYQESGELKVNEESNTVFLLPRS